MQNTKKARVCVQGMHCASCDLLVQRELSELDNVTNVTANYTTQIAEIEYVGELNKNELQKRVAEYGYTITEADALETGDEPYGKRVIDAAVIAMILLILFLFAQEFQLIPSIDTSGTLSLATIAVIGLIASVSTCMATTGALFLSTIGRMKHETADMVQRIVPSISFNAGRIVTYAGMGFVNGAVGQVISKDLQMESSMNIIIGILMVLVGLDMLRIFSLRSLFPHSLVRNTVLRVEKSLLRNPRKTSFLLGSSTYWLPCGFTQSVQLYALAVADPFQSMLIMLVFVLGTTPALIGIGLASSVVKHRSYAVFMKVVGVFVFMVGLMYSFNFLTLHNLNPFARVTSTVFAGVNPSETELAEVTADGTQVLRMTVNNAGYSPSRFTVQHGKPVKWIITGEEVFGCQGLLQVPEIGISRVLERGENIVEFTPAEKGSIAFSCSSGSVAGQIEVL